MKKPTIDEVRSLAAGVGLMLDGTAATEWTAVLGGMLEAYDRLDALGVQEHVGHSPRDSGHAPDERDNPFGAWCWRVRIEGAPHGPLAGLRVAVKDNISVRGVPLGYGSSVLSGYVPDVDATVVERTLEAGGTILGMATCEAFCVSGDSHTSATGPVLNPRDPSRTSGGSSGGAAALVASGAVDLALGSDQGGSIRGPAAWCGVVGLKPTFGLVPYTGAIPGEMTVDHLGPIARDVATLATYLEILAGPDGCDPRQDSSQVAGDYGAGLDAGISGIRIGVVAEGFSHVGLSEEIVDLRVREAVRRFQEFGAVVEDISLPFHLDAGPIRAAILFEGTAALLSDGFGVGSNWKGRYPEGFSQRMAAALADDAGALPETLLTMILAGRWAKEVGRGEFYAKAQNLARSLTARYDEALSRYDLLVMPTIPMRAPLLTSPEASLTERLAASRRTGANTSPFNITGHPALTVPCAVEEGLPIGMMLVGRRGADALVLRAGAFFERNMFRMPAFLQ